MTTCPQWDEPGKTFWGQIAETPKTSRPHQFRRFDPSHPADKINPVNGYGENHPVSVAEPSPGPTTVRRTDGSSRHELGMHPPRPAGEPPVAHRRVTGQTMPTAAALLWLIHVPTTTHLVQLVPRRADQLHPVSPATKQPAAEAPLVSEMFSKSAGRCPPL